MDGLEYNIGRFTLQPSRQLLDAGVPVPLGRKALELLSVLAKAEGALVTKDELMAAVWPKTVVEDNALQVHIVALRKALGQDAPLLSTVHGLGYRLTPSPRPQPGDAAATPLVRAALSAAPSRWKPILSAILPFVALATASIWQAKGRLPWAPPPREARVAVLPFDAPGAAGAARGLAGGLPGAIVSELSDNQVPVVSAADSQALRGPGGGQTIDRLGVGLLLGGEVRDDGDAIVVRVHLDDTREHQVIWSDEFRGGADAPEALQADVAAHAADAAHWAKVGRSGKVKLDAASLAAFIAGRESTTGIRKFDQTAALADYQKVVAAAPDFSWGHSAVAVADAFIQAGPESQADVQREAKRALALDPHNGEAYVALELALPRRALQQREALLIKGAAADPSFEPAALMEGRLRSIVGRGHDALAWLQRAHDLDPLHNNATSSLALALAAEGEPAEAQAVVKQMQAQWPEQYGTKDARFWTSVIDGDTPAALAQLTDPATRPQGMDQNALAAWRATLLSKASSSRAARAKAAQAVTAAAAAGSLDAGEAATLLTMLGDLDGAFSQASHYRLGDPYTPPYLFLPPTRAMRADPRFMLLAARLGLVDYWRATGAWPDFCEEPGLPYDCRREAAKAAAA